MRKQGTDSLPGDGGQNTWRCPKMTFSEIWIALGHSERITLHIEFEIRWCIYDLEPAFDNLTKLKHSMMTIISIQEYDKLRIFIGGARDM